MEETGIDATFPGTGAWIKLCAEKLTRYGQATLTSIAPNQAFEQGEACVQLLEGCEHEFELYGADDLQLQLVSDVRGVLSFSRLNHPHTSGRLCPRLYVGTIDLGLFDEKGSEVSRLPLEIRSLKLGYREHYRHMLEFITDQCLSLLLQIRSPATGNLVPDPGSDADTIGQRFEFLKALVDSPEFRDAITRITAIPHHLMERHDRRTPISARLRPSRSLIRQIARGARRVKLPAEHPLRNTGIATLPEFVTVQKRRTTLDTPENRFVKFALRSFVAFLAGMRSRLTKFGESTESPLNRNIRAVERRLETDLVKPFFREISDPHLVPLGSPVLQRKGGYRELLHSWLLFDTAAKLCWSGGDDVYRAGRRDVAVLYEYWGFFRLLDLVACEFNLETPPVEELIEETRDGFGLKLKTGRHLALKGTYSMAGRILSVQFSYNRTFSRRGDDDEHNYPEPGSWTEPMRPDYTLSLWPDEFGEMEAEHQELIVHVHFDAKYRVDHLEQLFGKSDRELGADGLERELSTEEEEQRGGTYKRADLLKMHAYRDAIRRTAGAYVLYPGANKREWRGFHEILPGLGAFPLRPNADGDDGSAELRDFIRAVAGHVCDKATLRERESYHRYMVHETSETIPVIRETPETTYDKTRRHPPPAETPVLVAWVKDAAHLDWIRSKRMYSMRTERQRGSIRLDAAVAGARYLLLHGSGGRAVDGLFEISREGPRVFSLDKLKKAGYPGDPSSPFYLVFDVQEHPDFAGYSWDYQALPHSPPPGRASAFPFTVTLAELMSASV